MFVGVNLITNISEIRQIAKDKYCMVSLICKVEKKNQTPRNRVEKWFPGPGGRREGKIGRGW